jgi:hypothetical protein
LGFAERALAGGEYRDSLAYLQRAQDLDRAGKQAVKTKALRQKIEKLAAAPAQALEAAIQRNEGGGWVSDFDKFRRQFEFADAASGVMAEYTKLHKVQEPLAEKLWTEVRQAFKDGNKEQGYRQCEEIVSEYYASSYYRYARQTLDERK